MGRLFILLILVFFDLYPLISKPYKGAELRTKESYLYGKFEVRMKSAYGSGIISSFFTYNDFIGQPKYNEIDFEILGRFTDEVQFNFITPDLLNHDKDFRVWYNPHATFHIYSFEWTTSYIAWFIDGFEIYRISSPDVGSINQYQKIMMNIWPSTRAEWAGEWNDKILPAFSTYDWVKYYSYVPSAGESFVLQWEDDFLVYDSSRWEKSTHTFAGNNCDFVKENVICKDGFIVLCLTSDSATGYDGRPIIDKDYDSPFAIFARSYKNDIILNFSEEITSSSAENLSNYSISGTKINSAILMADYKSVKLNIEKLDSSVNYIVNIINIKDRNDPPNILKNQSVTVSKTSNLPLFIDIGGTEWNQYMKDTVWDFSQNYGYEAGQKYKKSSNLQISLTDEDEVYRSAVEGLLFYRVRLPNGFYDITFMFCESNLNATGLRNYDIAINGKYVMTNLDIFKEAGRNNALNKNVKNIEITNNLLTIYFKSNIGKTLLNGLKIYESKNTKIDYLTGTETLDKIIFEVFPNPFNSSAWIQCFLPIGGILNISLFDITGKFIMQLENSYKPKGLYKFNFENKKIASGMYFLALRIDKYKIMKKILVLY